MTSRISLETHLPGPLQMRGRVWGLRSTDLQYTVEVMSVSSWTWYIHAGRRPLTWPPRPTDLTPFDIILWRHSKEHVPEVPPRIIDDLVAIQAAVTTVHVKACFCILIEGTSSNICYNYEVPMVWSFDSLRHLMVTKYHRTYILQCFRLDFGKESHNGGPAVVLFLPEYREWMRTGRPVIQSLERQKRSSVPLFPNRFCGLLSSLTNVYLGGGFPVE